MANNNQFEITGICKVTLEAKPSTKEKFVLIESNTWLDSSHDFILNQFYEKDGEMNKAGLMAMSNSFIQGLKASLERGDKSKIWDKDEHLLWINQEIMRLFPLKTTVSELTEKEVSHEG